MAESDYIWVSTPHDPLSISGSDPHALGSARLAAWYNCDLGNYVTGALKDSSWGYKLSALKDISGNSRSEPHSHAKHPSGTHRHLNSANYHRPILGANQGGTNPHITGHRQQFLMGSYSLSNGEGNADKRNLFMHNKQMGRSADNDTNSITWISGSHGNLNGYADSTLKGGYSLYTTMKLNTPNGNYTWPLVGATYPSSEVGNGDRNTEGNFSLYLRHNGSQRQGRFDWHGSSIGTESDLLANDWHILSGIYNNIDDPTRWKCSLYLNGAWQDSNGDTVGSGNYPKQHNDKKKISIGGGNETYGGGAIENTDMVGSVNGVHETFVFDDALSEIRNSQMSAYLCDRLEKPLSSSLYHSQFGGMGKGIAFPHSGLSSPLSGQGDNCRRYTQETTSSGQAILKMQHEAAGGAFAKATLDSGAYYRPASDKALSLRMWVRCERLEEGHHTGSFAAVVAKATSPFGHGVDQLKGYALKFGTMIDGKDRSDAANAPKFVLSLRNSNRWMDGKIDDGCTDIVLTASVAAPGAIRTPGIDTWYQIRLDVIPYGQMYDQIKAYASLDASTYYTLGDTQTIKRDSARYRHWCNDLELPVDSNDQNGIYNGYYTAMSSSTGDGLNTTYYLGKFEINTDTV